MKARTDTSRARKIIQQEYGNSKNFMTPDVLEYGMIGEHIAYELARGEGLDGQTIYGISYVYYNSGRTVRLRDFSDCYNSRNMAKKDLEYIRHNRAGVESEGARLLHDESKA